MHVLDELIAIAEQEHATLKLTLNGRGNTCITFKRYGGYKLELRDDDATANVRGIALALLQQVNACRAGVVEAQAKRDWETGYLARTMTPHQRERCARLLAEMKALRNEVLYPTPIEEIEPRLAPPRSCLNPQNFTAAHGGEA